MKENFRMCEHDKRATLEACPYFIDIFKWSNMIYNLKMSIKWGQASNVALFMDYDTMQFRTLVVQNYWVSGLCLSSGILNTRKHNVSETDPVSKTLFSSILNSGWCTQSRNPVILSVVQHRQNPLDSFQILSDSLFTYHLAIPHYMVFQIVTSFVHLIILTSNEDLIVLYYLAQVGDCYVTHTQLSIIQS
jgi:hypothetical protein